MSTQGFGQCLLERGFTKLEPDLLDRQMDLMRETADFKDRICLELGARDGRHSLMALELGALASTAVDGREDNFPAEADRHPHITYTVADARRLPTTLPFDIVLCYGLLYHVQDPGDLIKRMCKVASEWLFISTHCATVMVHDFGGYRGRWMHEGTADIDAMEPSPSLWLHPSELRRALADNGFEVATWVDYTISGQRAVWLAARPVVPRPLSEIA